VVSLGEKMGMRLMELRKDMGTEARPEDFQAKHNADRAGAAYQASR
jgi:hypothetical protein